MPTGPRTVEASFRIKILTGSILGNKSAIKPKSVLNICLTFSYQYFEHSKSQVMCSHVCYSFDWI